MTQRQRSPFEACALVLTRSDTTSRLSANGKGLLAKCAVAASSNRQNDENPRTANHPRLHLAACSNGVATMSVCYSIRRKVMRIFGRQARHVRTPLSESTGGSGQNRAETVTKLTVEHQLSGLLLQDHLIRRTRNLFGGRA